MANATRNYQEFTWENQTINGQLVNFIRVRIFNPIDTVPSNGNKMLVVTDGDTVQRSPHSFLRYTSNYSYVILSSGIRERSSVTSEKTHLYLHIKVYLTDDFDMSMWSDKDFLEKPFVLEALNTPTLPPPLDYLRKKVGDDYEEVYQNLKSSAQAYDFDKVEELFEAYKIDYKYQSFFWRELYQELAKKEA